MSTRPLLLGHRGARRVRELRENTIPSFDRALQDGCDGFEFDVRLTADGEAVLWHDPESDGRLIAESSVGELPHLARLSDVLARFADKAFLDIELKVAGLEEVTRALIREHPPRRGFVVSSFLPGVLKTIRSRDAECPLGLICETKAEFSHWPHLPVEYVIPHHELLDADLSRRLKLSGKKIIVWTVNHAAKMEHLIALDVDGIIADDTELLGKLFDFSIRR